MLDVVDHIGRVEIGPEIHHQISERIDQVKASCREFRRPLVIQQLIESAVLYRSKAGVFFSEQHFIGWAIAVQEDTLDAIHFLAEHQARLPVSVERLLACVFAGPGVSIDQYPGAALLIAIDENGQMVAYLDNRLQQCAMIGAATGRCALEVKPRGDGEWAEKNECDK